jgi:hypothetical protein
VDGSFKRAGYNRPPGVIHGGVVDNAMAEQRPILHQPEHGVSPGCFLSRWSAQHRYLYANRTSPVASMAANFARWSGA